MDIQNCLHKPPQAYQRDAPRRYWGVDLQKGGVPQVEIIKRVDIVAVAGNPLVSTSPSRSQLTYYFSRSWQNICCIKSHRFIQRSGARDADVREVGILLLRPSGGKPPRSRDHTKHTSAAACSNDCRGQHLEASDRYLRRKRAKRTKVFVAEPDRKPGAPDRTHIYIS